jgi:hypothetical protein
MFRIRENSDNWIKLLSMEKPPLHTNIIYCTIIILYTKIRLKQAKCEKLNSFEIIFPMGWTGTTIPMGWPGITTMRTHSANDSNSYLASWCRVRLRLLGVWTVSWPIASVPFDGWNGEFDEMTLGRGKRSTQKTLSYTHSTWLCLGSNPVCGGWEAGD